MGRIQSEFVDLIRVTYEDSCCNAIDDGKMSDCSMSKLAFGFLFVVAVDS